MKFSNSKDNEYSYEKDILHDELYSLLYKCVIYYKTPEQFITNTAVSIEHRLFEDIRNKVNKFEALDLSRATSIDEIIAHLNTI